MSMTRYPAYKAAESRWLAEIPSHWGLSQSRRLFSLRNQRAAESDKQLTASQQHGVIYQDDFVRLEGRRVVEVIKGAEILKHVEPNDFVISMRSFQGGIERSLVRGCISSAYVMLAPGGKVNGPFFGYLLKSTGYIQALQTTSNLVRDGQALRWDNFTQIDLPVVPVQEQAAIAAFLDAETAKIDALVAEQERLIELLKEKRQAVISRAVTKGLNPDAPMKDSGIEWLSSIPAHWEAKPLRHFDCEVRTGPFGSQLHAEEYVVGGTPVVNPTNLVDGKIVASNDVTVPPVVVERLPHQKLRLGDVVFARRGELGRCALVTDGEVGWLCGTGSMVLRLGGAAFLPEYFALFIGLELTRSYFVSFSVGAVMDNLSSSTLLSLPVPLPPRAEQREIVDAVSRAASKLNDLISEAGKGVALLQERRTALISAAVTGQIDVRPESMRTAA